MRLRTLGGLGLEESDFSRPKLLLLLCYLALEGPQDRRFVAELFWLGGKDHMKSLTVALARLRRGAPGAVEADDRQVWTDLKTDVGALLEALEKGDISEVSECYRGAFLESFYLRNWNAELEEWVYAKRESLTEGVRQALLVAGEQAAARGQFEVAGDYAEEAYRLAGAPGLEPEAIERLGRLLLAAERPGAAEVQKDAKELGLTLSLSGEDARQRLQQRDAVADSSIPHNLSLPTTTFVGRDHELTEVVRLLSRPGCQLLTLVGPAGVGKTRLSLQVADAFIARGRFGDGIYFISLAPLSDQRLMASSIAQALGIAEDPAQPVLHSLKDFLRNGRRLLVLDNFEHIVAAAPVVADLLTSCPALKIIITSRIALRLSMEYQFPVAPLALPPPENLPNAQTLKSYPATALFVQRARTVNPNFSPSDEDAPVVAALCARLDGLPLAIELAAARIKLFSPQGMLGFLDRRLELLKGGARDKPERHQTLRQAIAWSYELLNEAEQAFFRRLAVFVDGATLEAAAQVCNAAGELNLEVLDLVAILVNSSLLRQAEQVRGEPRFLMLEMIREYGLERLQEAGEAEATRRAHADYFLTLAENAEPKLTGPEQGLWLDRLEAEHDNLRAVFSWAKGQGDIALGLRLGAALFRFWIVRGHMREGRLRLERLVALARDAAGETAAVTKKARARALSGLGMIVDEIGDVAASRTLFEESLALWRAVEDKRGTATLLNHLGWVEMQLGDYQAARTLSEEARDLNRELGETRGVALALNNLGWTAQHQGNPSLAQSLHQQSKALRHDLGDRRGYAFALTNLGWASYTQGDYDGAAALLEEALGILRKLDDKQLIAWALCHQGQALFEESDDDRAEDILTRSVSLWRKVGNRIGLGFTLRMLAHLELERADFDQVKAVLDEGLRVARSTEHPWNIAHMHFGLGRLARLQERDDVAASCYRESLVIRDELGDKQGLAACLEAVAELALNRECWSQAASSLAAAETLREEMGCPLPPRYRSEYEAQRAKLHAELDEELLVAAWSAGREMTLEQAINDALQALKR